MKSKRFLMIVLLSFSNIVSSCNSVNTLPSPNNRGTNQAIPSPSVSAIGNLADVKPDPSEKNVLNIDTKDSTPINKPIFNDYPTNPAAYEKTRDITVIYKNEYFVRLDKKTNKLISNGKYDDILVTNLLNKYGLVTAFDSAITDNQQELDAQQRKTSQFYQTDIPHSSSIHYYKFKEEFNSKELCETLRSLPFVLTAYPKTKARLTSAPKLGGQTINTYQGNTPSNNSWYSTYSEGSHWWWYNLEKIFHGWDYYKSYFLQSDIKQCPMPTIAVIDTDFDFNSADPDKPNYIQGFYMSNNHQKTNGNVQTLLQPPFNQYRFSQDMHNPSMTFTHGDACASVAANPGQAMGIAPGAPIFPVRIGLDDSSPYDFNSPDMNAVGWALDELALPAYNYIDVISMSIGGGTQNGFNNEVPITIDTSIRAKIATLIANGKVVVISSGNTYSNFDQYSWNPTPPSSCQIPPPGSPTPAPYTDWGSIDVGEIIVGGSEIDNTFNPKKSKAWIFDASQNKGTTFTGFPSVNGCTFPNSNRVDLTAGAENIWTRTLNPITSTRFDAQLMGTSFAVPQVAAAAGMMKKIASYNNLALQPYQIRSILIMSSSLGRHDGGYAVSPYTEYKFLGRNLGITFYNPSQEVSLRNLNLYNALVIAKNMKNYQAIVRVFNIDDVAWASLNSNWGSAFIPGTETYGNDSIYGLDSLASNTNLSFATCNGGGTPYTYG